MPIRSARKDLPGAQHHQRHAGRHPGAAQAKAGGEAVAGPSDERVQNHIEEAYAHQQSAHRRQRQAQHLREKPRQIDPPGQFDGLKGQDRQGKDAELKQGQSRFTRLAQIHVHRRSTHPDLPLSA
jgi:hypothetical protein